MSNESTKRAVAIEEIRARRPGLSRSSLEQMSYFALDGLLARIRKDERRFEREQARRALLARGVRHA